MSARIAALACLHEACLRDALAADRAIYGGDDAMSEFRPEPNVRSAAYIHGGCPGCGRHRLEVYVDGPEGEERAVGIRCEKCYRQWLLDPDAADFHSDHSDNDPLNPQPPENDVFGGGS